MRKLSKPTVAVLAGLGAIALSVGPSYASAGHGTPSAETPVQLAHSSNRGQPSQGQQGQGMMNPGQQGQSMMNPGQQGQSMMNPGQQGQGNMNPGQQGQGMMNPGQQGQSMMNPGQQGQGMMNPGQQGQGMMNPGQQGQGMMGGGMMNMMRQHMMGQGQGQGMMGSNSGIGMGFGGQVIVNKDLTVDDVSHFLEHRLEARGNARLTLGDVVEVDGDKITADINTVDGSLVQRLEIDLHSGKMRHMQQDN